jgi:CxxC motif-containing protein (DUF1111 family)
VAGLDAGRTAFFDDGLDTFNELDSVDGSIANTSSGLGPRFNLDSCGGCHAHPAAGGSSPGTNPQVAVATRNGARNTLPSFITLHGPVREARFVNRADGTADGGVHDLFVISGRRDAPFGCNITQENFAAQLSADNVVFRIPTPVFGAGLVEAIPDNTIVANQNANASLKKTLGISGHPNHTGNDGTITRFGWKAQNKSLMVFSGEAYNVEQGISNEVFMQEREETPACFARGFTTPDDLSHFDGVAAIDTPNDVERFSFFMRFLAPPTPAPDTTSIQRGRAIFADGGTINRVTLPGAHCTACHTASLKTGNSEVVGISNQQANLFSDLLVHNMGTGLADGVSQGEASGDEFRTAPLWGVGQRIFFLHDGRTSDLVAAIKAHKSSGSEANTVVDIFFGNAPADSTGARITESQRQDVLNFLRSL